MCVCVEIVQLSLRRTAGGYSASGSRPIDPDSKNEQLAVGLGHEGQPGLTRAMSTSHGGLPVKG